MTTDDKTPMLKAAVEATSQAIRQALDGPSVATGRPPRASEITLADVMDRIDVTAAELRQQIDTIAGALNDGAPGWLQAMATTNARLRSQLAEAREQRDQAAEALVQAEAERDEARDAQVQHAAEIDRLRIEAAVLIDDLRAVLARSGKAVTQLRDDLARLRTEAAMLRAEVKRLSARVREWEAVNADLAARCDSGDIPTRPGERYSQAALREIDRLRTERDRLMDELPEDNTIVAAIRRLRAALAARAAEHRHPEEETR